MPPCLHEPAQPEMCYLCALARDRADYREAWSSDDKPRTPLSLSHPLPCKHEGAILEPCYTCGAERRHVRDCDLHEKCTRGYVSNKVKACIRCADYVPA